MSSTPGCTQVTDTKVITLLTPVYYNAHVTISLSNGSQRCRQLCKVCVMPRSSFVVLCSAICTDMTTELTSLIGALSLSEPPMRTLPLELYRDIFRYVPSMRDLCNMSILCRELQPEAEFFIYRTVHSTSRSQTEYLSDIITSSAHRHMLVRSLSISHDGWKGSPISAARDQEYWERIARLLHDLPYLQDLKIHDMAMQHGNPNAWVLSRALFSLVQFDSDFVLDERLTSFLRAQRQLKRLYWTENYADDDSRRTLDEMSAVEGDALNSSVTLLNTNSPRFALRCMRNAKLSHVWICGPCAYEDEGWVRYLERFVADGSAAALLSLRLNLPYRMRTVVTILSILAKATPNMRSLGFLPFFTFTVRIGHILPFRLVQGLMAIIF